MNATAARQTITLAEAEGVRPVLVLTGDSADQVIWPCSRCWNEDGYISMYSHVEGGVCFKCHGFGGVPMAREVAQAKADKLLKGRVARARKVERERLAKLDARSAAQQAIIAEHPALEVLLDVQRSGGQIVVNGDQADWYHDYIRPMGQFVAKIAEDFRAYGKLSARQIESVEDAILKAQARIAEREAERAAAVSAPTGRVAVTGSVIGIKEYDNDYSYNGGTIYKMTVKADGGFRVFVTIPADINPSVGDRVEFTATLKPKAEDPTFAKGSRPAKARVL